VSDGRAPANTIEVRYMLVGDGNPDRSVDGRDAVTVTRNYMVAGKSAWDQGTLISNRRHLLDLHGKRRAKAHRA